jgi:hypothetical protein
MPCTFGFLLFAVRPPSHDRAAEYISMAPAATQKSARPIGLHECSALAAVVRIPESGAQEMHFWRAAYAPSGVDRIDRRHLCIIKRLANRGNSLLACIVWENGLELFFWRHTYNA